MNRLTRRRLLQGGMASLVAAPFLNTMSRSARAADLGGAKRLLVFFKPNGTIHNYWRPTRSGDDFSFGEECVLSSLAPYKEDLLFLDGIDFLEGQNHDGGMAAMLTASGGISIDQHIANSIGHTSPFPSLELGVQSGLIGGQTTTRMCYKDGVFVTPNDDPVNAYQRIFGELGDEVKLARRRSVLDVSRSELADLRSRLGSGQRGKLEYHLDSLEQLERSLQFDLTCDEPREPEAMGINQNDNFPALTRQQIDLAVQVLACGATNVVSLQLSYTLGETVFRWLDQTDGHHTLSHMDDHQVEGVDSFMTCERWYAEQFAYLLSRLADYPDPETGGSMLDSTLVLWPSEIGDGRQHLCEDVPWIIGGNAGGFFTSGQYLSLGGVTHDRVLTTISNAFGLSDTSFGKGTDGPISDLS